jgi:hypothetical protein
MERIADAKMIDLPLEEKRGRGRPPKTDVPINAEPAWRFPTAHSLAELALSPTKADLDAGHAEINLLIEKNADLQLKLDCERQARIDAERRLAALKAKMGK